eukprot:scpid93606/ scgid29556/ 
MFLKAFIHVVSALLVSLICTSIAVSLGKRQHDAKGRLQMSKTIDALNSLPAGSALNEPPKDHWPEKWISDWTLYHVLPEDPTPPYADGKVPEQSRKGRGRTYYDWSKLAIIEEYYDFCVPIFVEGHNFTCHFLNVNNVSYFITFDDRPSWTPPCCIFGKPWLPPSPSTISNTLPFYGKKPFHDREVNWYRNTPPAGELTFGYGFYADTGLPAEFFFNGQHGWALQDFANLSLTTPPDAKWILPKSCEGVKECDLPH